LYFAGKLHEIIRKEPCGKKVDKNRMFQLLKPQPFMYIPVKENREVLMEHVLPELPYAKNALQPFLSVETLEFHHDRHHGAYVTNLNKLIKGTEFENMGLDDIVKKASGPVFNNAAQHWNHSFFWKCLRPKQDPELDEGMTLLLNANFGSLAGLKEKFTAAALGLFGSGWVWLVDEGSEKLSIVQSQNAGNPMVDGKKPLLVLDVWEHAYYIDYRNRRADYMEAFWGLINWDFAMKNHREKITQKA
jgi:superoxide dismutase, Fe-Mn family